MSTMLLVSGDLMLGARVAGAAKQCGLSLVTVGDPLTVLAAVQDQCRLVLIDLRLQNLEIAALVDQLRQQNAQLSIVACGPHVHEQRLQAAKQAGCDSVVTRGQLEREAESIFSGLIGEV